MDLLVFVCGREPNLKSNSSEAVHIWQVRNIYVLLQQGCDAEETRPRTPEWHKERSLDKHRSIVFTIQSLYVSSSVLFVF